MKVELNEMFNELFSKKVTKNWSDGGTYQSHVIAKESRAVVEQIIRQHLLDNRDSELAELKAKVFMYEEIIKKSNFAPMLTNEPKTEETQ